MKYLIVAVSFLIFGFSNCEAKNDIKHLSLDQVKKRFGTTKLNEKSFENGSKKIRASMAYSLIKSKKYIGVHRGVVENKLGKPTGYFRSETFLTYLIYVSAKGPVEALQLLFIPNKEGIIKEVVVHDQSDI